MTVATLPAQQVVQAPLSYRKNVAMLRGPQLEAVRRACPVVGSYPGADFTARSGRKLDQALNQYGIPHDIKIYPGARHSFFNERGRAFNSAAATDSWQRVLAFFETHVRGGPAPAP